MKLEVDLDELGASLIAAPAEAVALAVKAKNTAALDLPWSEKLSLRAVEAEEKLWDLLGNDDTDLTDKDRMKGLIWYADNHPETRRRPEVNLNMMGGNVTIDLGMLKLAASAAAECPMLPAGEVIDIGSKNG